MGRTLLAGDSNTGWREWLRAHAETDLVVLDPAEAHFGPAGRLTLIRGGRVASWRFYGSLDPQRAPHILLAGAASLLQEAASDAIVQLFPYRATPLVRQLVLALDEMVEPDRILTPEGSGMESLGWSVGPECIHREPGFPEMVRHAQRKAQWLKLLEEGAASEYVLGNLAIRGARLGSGHPVTRTDLDALGLADVLYAELCGRTLLVVADSEPDDASVSRALDRHHAQRLHLVRPSAYHGLLCALARDPGEPLGLGRLEKVDFRTGIATVLSTAQEGAGARSLLLGGLILDADGNEQGEVRPWQV